MGWHQVIKELGTNVNLVTWNKVSFLMDWTREHLEDKLLFDDGEGYW